jgi:uncharacterized membrane protein YqjE
MNFTKITLAVLAALVIAVLIAGNSNYRVLLQFTIFASVALVVLHALRARAEYRWAGVLGGIALLLVAGQGSFVLELISLALFLVYYRVCIANPRFSAVSVANRRRS